MVKNEKGSGWEHPPSQPLTSDCEWQCMCTSRRTTLQVTQKEFYPHSPLVISTYAEYGVEEVNDDRLQELSAVLLDPKLRMKAHAPNMPAHRMCKNAAQYYHFP